MKYALMFFGLLLSFNLFSQNLSEKLGAIPTDFVFTTDNEPMVVYQQHIIERASLLVAKKDETPIAAGYKSYWLEIETDTKLNFSARFNRDGRKGKYNVACYDVNGELLGMFPLSNNDLRVVLKEQFTFEIKTDNRFVSINIRTIPLVVLDKTKRIDLIY
jgi:hypothetical protein